MKIVGNIGYNRAELTRADLTQADLTQGRVDPHSLVGFHPATRRNPGRFAPDPIHPLSTHLVLSPLVDSPQEEISTYFVEIYVNS